MIVVDLIKHEWTKTFRSKGFYKNLTVEIFLGIFGLYIVGIFLLLGFSLNKILEEVSGGTPTELFNSGMLFLLLVGLLMRFLMQPLTTINLQSYQVLPFKRLTLINFLILKPLFSLANYFSLLIVIPFAINSVSAYYSFGAAFRFVVMFELFVWFNSLMAAFLKRKFGSGLYAVVILLFLIGGFVGLEYLHLFSLSAISKAIFGFVVFNPVGLIIPVAALLFAFVLNSWFFKQNYYPESFDRKLQASHTATTDLSFLNRFGIIGELIGVQLKLMLRHKRTRSLLVMSVLFLCYGLLFYNNSHYGSGMRFFCAMFVTGILMFIYGQWSISWDSAHFDSILTKNIPARTYVLSNYYLMLAFNIICFVLTTPYFLFGMQIAYLHLTAFLFNIGVNSILLLFLSTYNTKRVDLSKSSAMNYQGTTYKSFLIVLPILFFPMVWVNALLLFTSLSVALWSLASLGIAGLLFRRQLLTLCVNQFNKRKYAMAEGFRESE